MFSFLWSLAFRSSQPPPLEDQPPPLEDQPLPLEDQPPPLEDQPPPLEDDPTGGPSHTASGPHNYKLPRPDLYPGPIDVAPVDMPELFDVLLNDVDEEVLHNDISTALGSTYLSETPHLTSPRSTVDGIVFGRNKRVFFPLVVRLLRKRSYVMHFLYESGSPYTFLSQEVC